MRNTKINNKISKPIFRISWANFCTKKVSRVGISLTFPNFCPRNLQKRFCYFLLCCGTWSFLLLSDDISTFCNFFAVHMIEFLKIQSCRTVAISSFYFPRFEPRKDPGTGAQKRIKKSASRAAPRILAASKAVFQLWYSSSF